MRVCGCEWYERGRAVHVCGLDMDSAATHDHQCRTCGASSASRFRRVVEVRLCIETGAQVDSSNYRGPVHCTRHPDGYACTTALYTLRDNTILPPRHEESA